MTQQPVCFGTLPNDICHRWLTTKLACLFCPCHPFSPTPRSFLDHANPPRRAPPYPAHACAFCAGVGAACLARSRGAGCRRSGQRRSTRPSSARGCGPAPGSLPSRVTARDAAAPLSSSTESIIRSSPKCSGTRIVHIAGSIGATSSLRCSPAAAHPPTHVRMSQSHDRGRMAGSPRRMRSLSGL